MHQSQYYVPLSSGELSKLQGQTLQEVSLSELSKKGGDFGATVWNYAEILDCNLKKTNFYKAYLTGVQIVGTDLSKSNFGSSTIISTLWGHSNFDGASLAFCKVTDSYISHTSFYKTDLFASIFITATFSNSTFSESRLKRTEFRSAILKACVFSDISFEASKLHGVIFDGCGFQGAIFDETNFQVATFKKCDLDGTVFRNTQNFDTIIFDHSTNLDKADFGPIVLVHHRRFTDKLRDSDIQLWSSILGGCYLWIGDRKFLGPECFTEARHSTQVSLWIINYFEAIWNAYNRRLG